MRRFWLSYPEPNNALEPTPYSLRSYLASASGHGSPPAFGCGEGEAIADDDTHTDSRQLRRPEAAMIRKTFILLLALLLAAVMAQAQQAGKGHRIGVLLYAGAPPGLLEAFWKGSASWGTSKGTTSPSRYGMPRGRTSG